jgi:hydroxyethylthiazole kinase-like uncharacterized protein yjeF
MDAILPVTRPWPLHDLASTRALEQSALATSPPHALMARAGLAVARLALATCPGAKRVHAVAGPGNNGGDALVAARWLQRQGLDVRVTLLADPEHLPDDAGWALREAGDLRIESASPDRFEADLLLDGLLGIGLRRAPSGALADAIRRLNAQPSPVLSIDIPSGLDAECGTCHDGLAVRAAHTLSLLTLKTGLFTAEGRDHAGRVWLDTLGVDACGSAISLIGPQADKAAPHASHKGRFGDVAVVGGAAGMAGAAWLAASAALAAGAGRVFVGLLDPSAPTLAPARPELMSRSAGFLCAPERLASLTVVAGCGGGDAVRDWLSPCVAHAARLILDADALNAVAREPALTAALQARGARGRPTLLTPHPLEAGRLLGQDAAAIQADRPTAARVLAARFGATVVLKGSGTLVATPDGHLYVNATGNARLASAGTGDVLAGWTAGLWSWSGGDAIEAASRAVFRHGLAAERAGGAGPLLAADLIHAMQAL